MPRFYTGIGARRTPPEVLALMTRAAFALLKRGYVLRSGHAIGADSAFERGAGEGKQIFLPAPGWRGSGSARARRAAWAGPPRSRATGRRG